MTLVAFIIPHKAQSSGNDFSRYFQVERVLQRYTTAYIGGAHGVMVIIVGNGHGDTSSNPGRD